MGHGQVTALEIGVDLDGVIYPFAHEVTKAREMRDGVPHGTYNDEPGSWTWYQDDWGMDFEHFDELCRYAIQAGVYESGVPTTGSLYTLRRLTEDGHRIWYVTDRARHGLTKAAAAHLTSRWLHTHDFPQRANLLITADKASLPTDVFLDDKVSNVEALVAAGCPRPLLWHTTHNAGLQFDLERCMSWAQFYETCTEEATQGEA